VIVALLFPVRDPRKGGAARKYDDRLVLDAILFVLRSGCQWRMIPRDLLPWDVAYRRFRVWSADGTLDRIHDALRDQVRVAADRQPSPSAAVLDAQSIKSSEGGEARGVDMAKKTTGRKRHLVVDTLGMLLQIMVTAASVQDRPGGRAILERLADQHPTVELVWADGGYANSTDSSMVTWARQELGLSLEIIKRNDDVKGFQPLPRRWVVERTFGWIIRNRRLARDYERLTTNSEAMIKLAMIHLMANRLAGQASRWSNATHRHTNRRPTIENELTA
jgi:transposase